MNFKSIKHRVIFSVILASIVPLCIFAALTLYQLYIFQTSTIISQQQIKAKAVAEKIEGYFERVLNDVDYLFSVTVFPYGNEDQKKRLFASLIAKNNQYERLTITNRNGVELFFVDRVDLNFENTQRVLNQELAHKALKSHSMVFGSIYFDAITYEPLIDGAIVIKTLDPSVPKEILYVQIRFKKIWEIVSSLDLEAGEDAFIVDAKERVIAHKNPSLVIKQTNLSLDKRQGYVGKENTVVLRSTATSVVGDTYFHVVVERNIYDAHALTLKTLLFTVLLVLALIGLIVIVMAYIEKTITSPILNLSHTAKAIKDGDWNRRAMPEGNDELTILAEVFNEMIVTVHELKTSLESKVKEKTVDLQKLNDELTHSLETLHQTQEQLIYSEKMASLGALVAGVAHEINTPLGNSITAITFIEDHLNTLQKNYETNSLSEEEFQSYITEQLDVVRALFKSLKKASDLVQSFKRIAVDQNREDTLEFDLYAYIKDVFQSLYAELKKVNAQFVIEGEACLITSSPSAISQIITNLVMNSIIHGLQDGKILSIFCSVTKEDNHIVIRYSDNGKGIETSNLEKIFEPFFTTNRQKGGSGLGLNIVYNLVRSSLNGEIVCHSQVGNKTEFIITFPDTPLA